MGKKRIILADSAIQQFKENYEFIFKDSKKHAELMRIEIRNSILKLENFPLSGRIVPEESLENFQEIFVGNYRIMYEILEEEILITHIFHMSKKFTKKKI